MFEFTAKDKYRKIREGTDEVSFSYLANYVSVDLDKRELAIAVDDHFIDIEEKLDEDEKPEDWEHPLLPQAGMVVTSPVGEQLIEFCEADIEQHMKFTLSMMSIFSKEEKKTEQKDQYLHYYDNYEYFAGIAEDVMRSNLYVHIFPPLIYKRSLEMCKAYFLYLRSLQKEYRQLLDFCFNADFYKEELAGITAASRFTLYCEVAPVAPIRSMNISFRFLRSGFGNASMPVRDKQAYEEFKKNPAKKLQIQKREPNAFEQRFNINPIQTELARIMPVPIVSSYRCQSLDEILYLEFEKMLELDMQIKRCKNCNRYFILKGNYQTEYCDRIPDGETQNCQAISATAKYAQKVKDNPALAIFNKSYKRYHARLKVGSVKPDAFKKWKYEAVMMRDRCLDEEVTVEEFTAWIDGYFG
ncbi:MAG: DUF6076 domain-containing protein [Oscillospiraceae bacterium]|nr:DUF6076 domain-containing protein [Oscillospiraceae bacterium]